MSGKQETSAAIIAEMRGARTEFPFVYLMGEPDTPEVIDYSTKEIIEPRKINIRRVTVKELADRLEAALGREREASGNTAAIRDALEHIAAIPMPPPNELAQSIAVEMREVAIAALAKPPRNCDVGTAEEQMKRQYDTMCNTTKACPDSDWSCKECFAKWAQMPYEEGGAK